MHEDLSTPRHCERSEAIPIPLRTPNGDCAQARALALESLRFLAMTGKTTLSPLTQLP
jgi:hypothetical protein